MTISRIREVRAKPKLTGNLARDLRQHLVVLFALCVLMMGGCSQANIVPSDFRFIMDVRSAEVGTVQNINIRINAEGEGRIEYYDTGGVIRYDTNDIVMYEADQIVKTAKINLGDDELSRLWEAIKENKFFELTADYRMAIGESYAFILVEADGRRHVVNNIGLEVPEIRVLVEATDAIMPDGVDLEYGKGYIP